jgi:hypothetical protein
LLRQTAKGFAKLAALLVLCLCAALPLRAQIDSRLVGSNQRQIVIIGDPSSSSIQSSVLSVGDAKSLSGLYGQFTQGLGMLLNSGGTYDQPRSTVGTTGIPVFNTEGTKASYRAVATALVTVTAGTDVFQVCGSATKTVRVPLIRVSGTIQTAAQYVDITLVKRSTADTGGTCAAPTTVPLDANDSAGTAVLLQCTANPTLGTPIGTISALRYFGALTGTAALMPEAAVFEFGNRPGARALVLRGVAQCVAVNLNAPSNAGTFNIEAEWTEE